MIDIDGTDGGGQILRTALGLAALKRKAFRIRGIRRSRPKPGLSSQHLECVRVMAQICDAYVEGARIGSEELEFIPRKLKPGRYEANISTAGSVSLILQSMLIPLVFAEKTSRVMLTGGTDVRWSMPVDYVQYVVFPYLSRFADLRLKVLRRGYFPKGGGRIEVSILPYKEKQQQEFKETASGGIEVVQGISHASRSLENAEVSERQAMAARSALPGHDVLIRTEYNESDSPGSGIVLWARLGARCIIGADRLGDKGTPAEKVGTEAAQALLEEIRTGAAIDCRLADNLIPFLGIAGGRILTSRITGHIRTNIRTTELFLGCRFKVEGNLISCQQR